MSLWQTGRPHAGAGPEGTGAPGRVKVQQDTAAPSAIGRGAEIPEGTIFHDGVFGLAGRDEAGVRQVDLSGAPWRPSPLGASQQLTSSTCY